MGRILTQTSHIVFSTTPDGVLDTSRAGSTGHNNLYAVTFVSVQVLKYRQPNTSLGGPSRSGLMTPENSGCAAARWYARGGRKAEDMPGGASWTA